MPTRQEMIAELSKGSKPTRQEMIAELSKSYKPEKSTLQEIGEAIDSYTGAPTRSAISKALSGDVLGAPKEFFTKIGEDPTKAPKGSDIAKQIGVSDKPAELGKALDEPLSLKGLLSRTLVGAAVPTPLKEVATRAAAKYLDERGVTNADLAGVPIEVLADWTNAIPGIAALLKSGAKTAKVAKALDKGQDVLSKFKQVPQELGMGADDVIKLANQGGAKKNAQEIIQAAEALGFKPTPAMLSENKTLQALESSLDQSESLGGLIVRGGKSGTTQVREGLKKAAQKFDTGPNVLTKMEVGDAVKADILEKVNLRYQPVAEKFENIRESTKFIEVPQKSKDVAARSFLRQRQVALSPTSSWGQKAQRYANDIKNVKNVDDIKELRSLALKEARAAIEPAEKSTLNYIAARMEALEGRVIKGASEAAAKTPLEGVKIGKELVKDLRTARKEFKGIVKPLGDVAKQTGVNKRVKSIDDFFESIDNIPSEQVADKLFKTNNVKALNLLKKEFPTSFDLIRNQRISEIIEKAKIKGEISPNRLISNLKQIGPEARELLFNSKDVNQSVKNLETVLNSLPDMVGPSGTPRGEMLKQIVNVPFQATELSRAALYKQLQNPVKPIDKVVQGARNMSRAGSTSPVGLSELLGVSKAAQTGMTLDRNLRDLRNKKR